MALRGLIGEMTLPGATDGLAFKTYVTQVLVPNLWVGACVVMDNLPAQKEVAGIREAIESVGATVVYLSPYSPDFSPPIELLVKSQRISPRTLRHAPMHS